MQRAFESDNFREIILGQASTDFSEVKLNKESPHPVYLKHFY